MDKDACSTGVLVQYADESREAIDCDLLFWSTLDVVRDNLEGGFRCFLVGDCATEYREDNGPLSLRTEQTEVKS